MTYDVSSSDDRTNAKYATAKYGPTVRRSTKYALTVDGSSSVKRCTLDLNRVFGRLK